ncbi:dehydrogenase, FMN-dependent [Salmonella enterica subsp. enterica serovar Dublin str. DG22]|uniref:Dehydrogenase, FMN-dependent n=8 Tax=Salmonella enterica TaxID=28901 RepID=M7RDQ0_SALDU|nr:dehydrogenase, FMN-dependent [Salmonella enterica subsp. enterica serovar Dublin str. UC16]EPI70304.1 dehydrogenase, FMN-dependent [Salmonella enterica subsp. enterica serovar Dublin str. DG22]SUG10127.1 L-lactate oxidase [Salmonella enterica subsp. enterica serovar Dublin]SUI07542.1 L-lactate oxidase [Salmonella enterica subsp. enterica serovar Dublin]
MMKTHHLIRVVVSLVMLATSGLAYAEEYKASTDEKAIKMTNVASLEARVQARMEKGAFGYIRGGAEDENNLRSNTESFDKKYIMPRVLQGIELKEIDLSTQLLGIPLKTPIIQAPMAAQGLAHASGELATAKGMAQVGSIFSLSTYGNKTIEEVANVSGKNPFFFQLYMSKNNQFNEFILAQAVKHGAKAIILTVDSPVGGYREEDIKNNFQFPLGFANLEMFARKNDDGSKTGKGAGISEIYAQAKQAFTPEDAEIAIQAGAAGIWVSNHGGRQLDSGPSSFDMLPAIAKVVNKRVPVIFDSGVRRGSHIFKALASGADIVAVGRPVLYGLNLGGAQGVASVIEQLNKELTINMMLGGARNIEQVKTTRLLTEKDLPQ